MRDLLTALTRDPDEATRAQRVIGGLLLLALLLAAGVEWT